NRRPRRDHRGSRVRLRYDRARPQLPLGLRARPPDPPPGLAEVSLPVLLLPRPRVRLLPRARADLVPLHDAGLRQRPRVARPPDGQARPAVSPPRECLPLARGSRAWAAKRRELSGAGLG